ncbi:MAG: hypothetical protein KGY80_07250 [Candidatus Thorarchaeota archaeon]|nr:hypothetical protein [Candidatus Thorarchaeota archaeon]
MTRSTFTFEELKKTNHKEIQRMQEKKFKAFIRYQVWPNHPYYRRMFKEHDVDPWDITCIDDWAKYQLPLVRKREYKDNLRSFVLNPSEVDGEEREPSEIVRNLMDYYKAAGYDDKYKALRNDGIRVKLHIGKDDAEDRIKEHLTETYAPLQFWLSSGRSSGLPSPVFLTRHDNDLLQKNCVKVGQMAVDPWIDSGWELVSMNLFPYAPHLGWHAVNRGLKQMSKFYLATSAGGAIPSKKLVEMAKVFKANGFAGMPSYLRNRFFKVMEESDYTAPEKVVILLAGEKIYRPVVEDMIRILKEKGAKEVRVVGGYASSETKISFAVQCGLDGPYHNVSPLMLAFRYTAFNDDGTYDFVSEGEPGHVTLFHLDGTGTIVEGFLLGDVASEHERGQCPHCGFDGPFFWDIGRENDTRAQLDIMGLSEKKVKGATVNLTALRSDLLSISQVDELQVEIAKEDMDDPYSMDVLNLYVAPKEKEEVDEQALISAIKTVTKNSTEVTPRVFVLPFEELMEKAGGMKFMEVQDVRPKPA